jgi:hypothetical protein
MQSSPDAEKIVAEARTWVGTPYAHQAQLKGVGVDCVGLILGTGKGSGFMGPDVDERFKVFGGYSRVPNPRRMREGMETFLDPAPFGMPKAGECPPTGSIGWFQWRADLPMHLAVIARFEGRPSMIHAYSFAGRAVEHTLNAIWLARLNSVWVYRGSVV